MDSRILCAFLCISLLCVTYTQVSVQTVQGCWQVLSPTRKGTSYSDRRFWFSYILFI